MFKRGRIKFAFPKFVVSMFSEFHMFSTMLNGLTDDFSM